MTEGKGTIRFIAVVIVGILSIFVMSMSVWLVWRLQSDWCSQVIGSAQYNDGRPDFAIAGCVSVMRDQISALANNSLVFGGVIALCLLALMVIVVASGKMSFVGPGGIGGSVGSSDDDLPATPAQGAQVAADAAQGAADAVAEQTEGER